MTEQGGISSRNTLLNSDRTWFTSIKKIKIQFEQRYNCEDDEQTFSQFLSSS